MPDEVILDVTTIEENVTVETTAGDVVEIQVVAPAGPAGATGPAGPNSVTSATTSDGTANLSIADLEVVGGEIYTDGDYSQIYTQGTDAHIFTLGAGAEIFTVGEVATIATQGANATISTAGAGATIGTQGANATIYTQGTNATISTAGSAAHIQTSHASAAVKSTNFAAVESGGASLVDGSMQPCLTWSAGGRNLTIPSGTATTFNTTSYTYGTGAAAAHRTALGLGTGDSPTFGGATFSGFLDVGDFTANGTTGEVIFGSGSQILFDGGSQILFNGISYTYGTGAAAAHRTALGLTTLATTPPAANVATFLETPTSANLAAALTDENGTGGGFVRAEGATLTTPTFTGSAARANGQNAVPATSDEVMTRGQSDSRIGKVSVMSDDVTVVSSTTPVPLTVSSSNHPDGLSELGFTLAANKTYAFEFIGEFYEITSPKNQLFTLAGPSGASFSSRIIAGASGSINVYQIGGGSTVSNLIITGASNGMIKIYGLIKMGATSGNVTLRFSQNSSTANPTTIKKGSTMILFGGA